MEDYTLNKRASLPNSGIRTKRRKLTTINDVLSRDEVNEVLSDMDKIKANLKHLIVIYIRTDDIYGWEMTDGIPNPEVVWLLEKTKLDVLSGNEEDKDE